MLKTVKKLEQGLRGSITIPSDKSISHRAVMFSSIAKGECIIRNFSSGADCHSTLNLFKQLGVDIQFLDNKTLKIKSTGELKKISNPLWIMVIQVQQCALYQVSLRVRILTRL